MILSGAKDKDADHEARSRNNRKMTAKFGQKTTSG